MSDAYAGLRIAQGGHVGGNVVEGDPLTFAPSVWSYVIERFGIGSVLDLGCGIGNAADWFARKGLRTIAVDGFKENTDRALYPAVRIDLTQGSVECRVDLVHCQEVVEHIDEKFLDNVLKSLACGKFILMTHALPHPQGLAQGHHHVNEKPPEYWYGHLARVNCHVMPEDTRRIRQLALRDGAKYLAETGLVLANRNR